MKYDDPSNHFRFTGIRASCQLEVKVEAASIGFSWKPALLLIEDPSWLFLNQRGLFSIDAFIQTHRDLDFENCLEGSSSWYNAASMVGGTNHRRHGSCI
jgi:hypothetical protein